MPFSGPAARVAARYVAIAPLAAGDRPGRTGAAKPSYISSRPPYDSLGMKFELTFTYDDGTTSKASIKPARTRAIS